MVPVLALGQGIRPDSARMYRAPEVVVTATRSPISEKDAPSPTEVLSANEIRNANGTTVADALQAYTGVLLREYGAGASLATVSLRGSASEHVLVLIDGSRFTGFQNGLVDFSLLPLDNISRIEILHGGASALYGADAVGGVINIITRPVGSEFRVSANGSVGSYGFQRYAARAQGGTGGLGILAGYSNERGKDNYPFSFQRPNASDTSLRRQDADYSKSEIYVNGSLKTDAYSAVDFSVQNITADRGVPGPIFSPSDISLAREDDKDANVHLRYRDNHISGTELSLNTGFQYSYETYVDPLYLINSFYKNIMVNVNPQAEAALGSNDRIVVGGEFVQGILQGNDFGVRIQRTQTSVYLSNEYVFGFDRPVLDKLSLFQTLRYDHFSDVGRAFTPKVGFNVRLSRIGDVRVRASYGTSYRAPSFNDLYYVPFNNPELRPEHSQSFDAGVLGSGEVWGRHSIEATYFYANTTDRIVFDPVKYVPVNIGKTVSQGVESSYRGVFFEGAIDVELSYTYTDARKKNSVSPTDSTFDKQLVFVPRNLLKASVGVHLSPVTLNLFRMFTGMRPVNEDNSMTLPAYSLTNANVRADFPFGDWKISAKLELDNIFDVRYQVYSGYPMPGRTYRLEFGVDY